MCVEKVSSNNYLPEGGSVPPVQNLIDQKSVLISNIFLLGSDLNKTNLNETNLNKTNLNKTNSFLGLIEQKTAKSIMSISNFNAFFSEGNKSLGYEVRNHKVRNHELGQNVETITGEPDEGYLILGKQIFLNVLERIYLGLNQNIAYENCSYDTHVYDVNNKRINDEKKEKRHILYDLLINVDGYKLAYLISNTYRNTSKDSIDIDKLVLFFQSVEKNKLIYFLNEVNIYKLSKILSNEKLDFPKFIDFIENNTCLTSCNFVEIFQESTSRFDYITQ